MHGAWLTGGSVIAKAAVEHFDSLRKPWVNGDEDKALGLTRVFTIPMISRWYRAIDLSGQSLGVSADDRQLGRKIAAVNLLTVFGGDPELEVRDFMNMDLQFNFEQDGIARKEKTLAVL